MKQAMRRNKKIKKKAGQYPHLHGILTFTNFKGNDWYVFVYTAENFTGELLDDVPEGKLEWIRDDEILRLPLWDSDQVFLPWVSQGRFFSGKFNYDGEKFVDHEVAFY